MSKFISLTKITKPGLPEVYNRTRLFNLLDKASARQLVWVAGPPGAGKTTLVCSYIDKRKINCLWYQIDETDADLASFFHYLGLAAKKAAPKKRTPLPHLTPEYQAGLSVFTQGFFQDLYSRLKTPFTIVFDDYQQVPESSAIHDAIKDGLIVLPDGGTVILLSRAEPPASLARTHINQEMSILGWKDLSLTADESNGIAKIWGMQKSVKDVLRLLHGKAEGWAAGLVLMLERIKNGQDAPQAINDLGADTLFDYFASEILQKTEPDIRDFLLKTSLLPSMTTEMAESLTGNKNANVILTQLSRNHYFTEKNIKTESTYQYHPMFREFLLSSFNKIIPEDERKTIQSNAALILEENGQLEAAVNMALNASEWKRLATIIITHAPELIAQGRYETLHTWIKHLPEEMVNQAPWLRFWLGACRLPFSVAESRDQFEAAYSLFEESKDLKGLCLCWSSIIETYLYEWGNFKPLDGWIEKLDQLLSQNKEPLSEEISARITASMFSALIYRQPQHKDFQVWEQRARALLNSEMAIHHRVMIGNQLILYYSWIGDLAKASLVIEILSPALDKKNIAPLTLIIWKSMESMYLWLTLKNDKALEAMESGLELANNSGIHIWDFMLYAQGMYGAVNNNDLIKAKELLKAMSESMHGNRRLDAAHYHYQAASLALLNDDLPRSLEHARNAVERAEEAGSPFPITLAKLALAQALFERDEDEQAYNQLNQALEFNKGIKSQYIEYHKHLLEGYFHLQRDRESEALPCIKAAFILGKEHGFMTMTWWRPDLMSSLCAIAIKNDIEIDHAINMIRRQNLDPAGDTAEIENWPWPIKIYTLGRFSIVLNDKPLRFNSRAQSKPLELLKILVAFGGREVSEHRFVEALWPDAEGDSAHSAFDTTLHRLRKLIGSDKAVTLQDGRLTLDPKYCWVDVWVYERLLGKLENKVREGAYNEIISLTDKVFGLYQGYFLGDSADMYWAMALRDRLHSKFSRQLSAVGQELEAQEQWDQAIEYYQRALEIDSLAESFYQRLIKSYQRQGRQAEAARTYQRCKETLNALLNVEPSPATQKLLNNTK